MEVVRKAMGVVSGRFYLLVLSLFAVSFALDSVVFILNLNVGALLWGSEILFYSASITCFTYLSLCFFKKDADVLRIFFCWSLFIVMVFPVLGYMHYSLVEPVSSNFTPLESRFFQPLLVDYYGNGELLYGVLVILGVPVNILIFASGFYFLYTRINKKLLVFGIQFIVSTVLLILGYYTYRFLQSHTLNIKSSNLFSDKIIVYAYIFIDSFFFPLLIFFLSTLVFIVIYWSVKLVWWTNKLLDHYMGIPSPMIPSSPMYLRRRTMAEDAYDYVYSLPFSERFYSEMKSARNDIDGPFSLRARLLYAAFLSREKKMEELVDFCENSIKKHSKNYDLIEGLGYILLVSGCSTYAENYFREAIKLMPGKPEAYNDLVSLFLGHNKVEVMPVLEDALKRFPNDPYLLYKKAYILHHKLKDHKQAYDVAKKALDLASDEPDQIHTQITTLIRDVDKKRGRWS